VYIHVNRLVEQIDSGRKAKQSTNMNKAQANHCVNPTYQSSSHQREEQNQINILSQADSKAHTHIYTHMYICMNIWRPSKSDNQVFQVKQDKVQGQVANIQV